MKSILNPLAGGQVGFFVAKVDAGGSWQIGVMVITDEEDVLVHGRFDRSLRVLALTAGRTALTVAVSRNQHRNLL